MLKPSKNPKVEELTKSYRGRAYPVTNLPYLKDESGNRRCIWCGDPLKSNHHAARYCKDPECQKSAYAWANPQGDDGKRYLLEQQGWKCKLCGYSWIGFERSIFVGPRTKTGQKLDPARRPEVDHIMPISKGGQALGLENHQAICRDCHRTKTKVDNSGPRKPKVP